MSDKSPRTFYLVHDHAKESVRQAIYDPAYEGWKVRISPPVKSREQEERYHAMIGDIAKQYKFCNRYWDAEDMKRLLLDQFKRDTINDPEFSNLWLAMGNVELAPALDGSGVVALGIQSRKFPKKLASAFIEWLYSFGSQVGVKFKEY